eukprot:9868484-Lingulodinium_polyedra.AAC.1
MAMPTVATAGKLVLRFRAQSFMHIYVGWTVRTSVTVPKGARIEATGEFLENDLAGCPRGVRAHGLPASHLAHGLPA